jgi:hypothetical protein
MHIEILFEGDIESITGQYIEHLDLVGNWLKINQIDAEMTYIDNKLILILPLLDDYALWVTTWNLAYHLVRTGSE